jgi:hypothetical protein
MSIRKVEPFEQLDSSIWNNLFPEETPSEIRTALIMHYPNPEEIDTVDAIGMAKTIWHEFISDDDRYYARHFTWLLASCWADGALDDYEDAIDDLIVESLARTVHWRAGVRF